MPTAFARLDARDTGYRAQLPVVLVFPVRVFVGRVMLDPRPKLTQEEQAVRRDTRGRFLCFVAWPSAS